MEIIKEGKIPAEREHTGTCGNCRCQVRFKEKEARFVSFPRNESAWVVKCPTTGCGKEIWVEV
jgi:hypothetical protein